MSVTYTAMNTTQESHILSIVKYILKYLLVLISSSDDFNKQLSKGDALLNRNNRQDFIQMS